MKTVGTKVKIREDLQEGIAYHTANGLYHDQIIEEMSEFFGKVATIVRADKSGYALDIDNEEWHWTDGMLESTDGFRQYRRTNIAEMTPYTEGMNMSNVSISSTDKENGSPKNGDMIARNPKDYNDKWLVSQKYFEENFELYE